MEKYVLGLELKVGRYLFCERIEQNFNYKSCGKNHHCPLSIICHKNSMNGLGARAPNIYQVQWGTATIIKTNLKC